MKFHAVRLGHTRNAKALLIRAGWLTEDNAATISSEDVDALISEHYVSVVLQEDAHDYDDIYLIPKVDFKSVLSIGR